MTLTWKLVSLLYAVACLTALADFAPSTGLLAQPAPPTAAPNGAAALRTFYAVNQASATRGSISVYAIDRGHSLIKVIRTVANVNNVKGVAASAATGKLYVAYRTSSAGMIYCLDLHTDAVLWNKAIDPDVDRLSINPDGHLLYVPTFEGGAAGFINVLDAETGGIVRRVHFSNRSHDTLFPLSGPIFQETKAEDGSGRYLYLIDPATYAVSRLGPYSGILGPYAVDGMSRRVVNNVTGLWGMQVAEIGTGKIVTAEVPDHPRGQPGLLHGIGFTPDEREVWHSSSPADPHVFIWDMAQPTAPRFKQRLALRSGEGSHWVTFSIAGDYAYVAPNKNSEAGTEIFDARTHASVGLIGSSEDMLEIDFADGKISRVGDQFGIGRVQR
jgi:6-phosphogluconolactonase (cycloisomerase 2 family)